MGGPDPDAMRHDLANAAMLAERLGLAHSESVHTWRRRYSDFPQPVFQRGQVVIWSWAEVRAWAIATGRLAPDADEGRPGD